MVQDSGSLDIVVDPDCHLLELSAVTKDLMGIAFSEKFGAKEIAQFSVIKSSP